MAIIDKLRTDVYKYCNDNSISVRQFLLEIGESSRINWETLHRTKACKGQIGLLVKLLNFFNYDNKTKNSV